MKELIQALKKRRKELDVTQEHLAELSEVGLRTLKTLESGKSNPTFETLKKLADVPGMELKLEVKSPTSHELRARSAITDQRKVSTKQRSKSFSWFQSSPG